MSGPERDKDTPPGASGSDDQPTTPCPSPTAGAGASAWDPTAPSWRLLATRFEILGELGRGGMGIVYKARDRETGEVVALKALKPEIAADSAVVERFKNELRLGRKITHKNVCRTYDLHRFGDVAVIAMEYVEGESLRQGLRRYAPLSVRKGLEFARQICAALAEAHAQGIVHRDLKPENIMLDDSGQVKVMDFGIARSVDVGATTTGSIVGTPAYMAPEQAEGKPVDHRADIYALGLMLYEMFTGNLPFSGDSPVAVAFKQVHETPPAPRQLEPTLPEHIEQAILKCLEKDPSKRFQSLEELEAALTHRPEGTPRAAESQEAEIPLPAHLATWQRIDYWLLALAIAGACAYFLLEEGIFPANMLRLKIDRSVAIRIAEENAVKLKAPHSRVMAAEIYFDTEVWRHRMWVRGRDTTWAELPNIRPIGWLVSFGREDMRELESTFWISGTDGLLMGFERSLDALGPSAGPVPSLVDLRQQGRTLLEDIFDEPRDKTRHVAEQLGQRAGYWQYTLQAAANQPSGEGETRYLVSLSGGVPTSVFQGSYFNSQTSRTGLSSVPRPRLWPVLSMVVLVGVALALFLVAKQQIFAYWKATGTAAFLFAVSYAYWELPAGREGGYAIVYSFFQSFSFAGLLAFMAIGSVVQLERKSIPSTLGVLSKLHRWRWYRQPVGLVLVRGALLGFLLLGLNNVLAEIGIRTQLYWLHPLNTGNALSKPFPPLQGLANAIVQSIQMVLVGVVLPFAFARGVLKRGFFLSAFMTALWMSLEAISKPCTTG